VLSNTGTCNIIFPEMPGNYLANGGPTHPQCKHAAWANPIMMLFHDATLQLTYALGKIELYLVDQLMHDFNIHTIAWDINPCYHEL
jgi:hypothetical protein